MDSERAAKIGIAEHIQHWLQSERKQIAVIVFSNSLQVGKIGSEFFQSRYR